MAEPFRNCVACFGEVGARDCKGHVHYCSEHLLDAPWSSAIGALVEARFTQFPLSSLAAAKS